MLTKSLMLNKNRKDSLEEEILRERAAVLERAGESVADALEKLGKIEIFIDEQLTYFDHLREKCAEEPCNNHESIRRQIVEINGQISKYNRMREYARLRYYYLIVTREAMGMHRHTWVEEVYSIPPRKRFLQEL